MRCGSVYSTVPEEEINKIKFVVGANGISNIRSCHAIPEVGETKMIQYGALSGLECEILNINNENKIIVQLN